MTTLKQHYERLGLSAGASPDEVKDAFRAIVKSLHPDILKREHTEEEKVRFTEVAESYAALKEWDLKKAIEEDVPLRKEDVEAVLQDVSVYFQEARHDYQERSTAFIGISKEDNKRLYNQSLDVAIEMMDAISEADIDSALIEDQYKAPYTMIMGEKMMLEDGYLAPSHLAKALDALRNPSGLCGGFAIQYDPDHSSLRAIEVTERRTGDWTVEGRQAIADFIEQQQEALTAQDESIAQQLADAQAHCNSLTTAWMEQQDNDAHSLGSAQQESGISNQSAQEVSTLDVLKAEAKVELLELFSDTQNAHEFLEEELKITLEQVEEAQAMYDNTTHKDNYVSAGQDLLEMVSSIIKKSVEQGKTSDEVVQSITQKMGEHISRSDKQLDKIYPKEGTKWSNRAEQKSAFFTKDVLQPNVHGDYIDLHPLKLYKGNADLSYSFTDRERIDSPYGNEVASVAIDKDALTSAIEHGDMDTKIVTVTTMLPTQDRIKMAKKLLQPSEMSLTLDDVLHPQQTIDKDAPPPTKVTGASEHLSRQRCVS